MARLKETEWQVDQADDKEDQELLHIVSDDEDDESVNNQVAAPGIAQQEAVNNAQNTNRQTPRTGLATRSRSANLGRNSGGGTLARSTGTPGTPRTSRAPTRHIRELKNPERLQLSR